MLIKNSKKGKLSSGELAEVETSYLPTPQTKEGSAGRFNCDRNRNQLVEKKGPVHEGSRGLLDQTIAGRSRWPVSQQTSTSKLMQTTSPNTKSIKQMIDTSASLAAYINKDSKQNQRGRELWRSCNIDENEGRHAHETSILFLIHHRHIKRTTTVKRSQTTATTQ